MDNSFQNLVFQRRADCRLVLLNVPSTKIVLVDVFTSQSSALVVTGRYFHFMVLLSNNGNDMASEMGFKYN